MGSTSSKDVSQIVEEVARAYDYRQPPGILVKLQELIDDAMRAIQDFLNALTVRIPGVGDTSLIGNIMQIVVIVIGCACVVLVMYALFKRLRNLQKQKQLSSGGAVVLELELDSKGWQAEAERLAQKKEYREALRALYFSFLRRLDEVEILKFSPTRTNYEYWYALARNKQMQQDFRDLADIVEDSWFGWLQPTNQDYERSLAKVKTLDQLISSEVASRPASTGDAV